MDLTRLRVALFSGNYNCTRDGANLALNRLTGFLLDRGAAVRIYSPVVDEPAFPATGDVVPVPALPIPGRSEYRLPFKIGRRIRQDLAGFSPNLIHVSAPELLGHWAVSFARHNSLPVLASVHTRFDTYLRYYQLGLVEPLITAILRRFYQSCDVIVAPTESMAAILRDQRMNADIGLWPSGVDQTIFAPAARSLEWRRDLGIRDDEVVIGFLGRLVMEKGLAVFADTIRELERRGIKHRVLVVGSGPALGWFTGRLPQAVFTGQLIGSEVGKAVASMDVLFNPSITETFGLVTLEAMSCGIPVVGLIWIKRRGRVVSNAILPDTSDRERLSNVRRSCVSSDIPCRGSRSPTELAAGGGRHHSAAVCTLKTLYESGKPFSHKVFAISCFYISQPDWRSDSRHTNML